MIQRRKTKAVGNQEAIYLCSEAACGAGLSRQDVDFMSSIISLNGDICACGSLADAGGAEGGGMRWMAYVTGGRCRLCIENRDFACQCWWMLLAGCRSVSISIIRTSLESHRRVDDNAKVTKAKC